MKKKEVVHGVIFDDNGAHLACNKEWGCASGYQYTANQSRFPVTCKRCKIAMELVFRCKEKKCPGKRKPQTKIGVVSQCTQTLNLKNGEFGDTEVGNSLYGYCLECGVRMGDHVFERLLNRVE